MSTPYNIFYKTENKLDSKFYYGVHKTCNIYDSYLGSGIKIIRAVKKYGKENFVKKPLYFFDTYEKALEFEKEFVNESLLQDPSCYNIKLGGKGGWAKNITKWNKGLTKETDERVNRIATINKVKQIGISRNVGVKHSIERRNNQSIRQTGNKHSSETKEKQRKSALTRTDKQIAWNKGLTKETDLRVKKYANSYPKERKLKIIK